MLGLMFASPVPLGHTPYQGAINAANATGARRVDQVRPLAPIASKASTATQRHLPDALVARLEKLPSQRAQWHARIVWAAPMRPLPVSRIVPAAVPEPLPILMLDSLSAPVVRAESSTQRPRVRLVTIALLVNTLSPSEAPPATRAKAASTPPPAQVSRPALIVKRASTRFHVAAPNLLPTVRSVSLCTVFVEVTVRPTAMVTAATSLIERL
jgi:hypothetical protein